MSNSIQLYQDGAFDVMQRAATALAASGYFPDAKTQAQAIVKVMAGAELGIAPFASMTGIHVIKGKATVGGALLAGIVKNDPRYDFRVIQMDDACVSLQFFERRRDGGWDETGISKFTAEDAKRAGTQNMGKFPRNMLFARAISNGAKWYAAGAGGGMPVYSEGELDTPQIVKTQTPRTIDEETGVIDGDFDEPDFIIEEEPPFVPDEPVQETAAPVATARNESDTVAFLNQEATGADWKGGDPSVAQLKAMQSNVRKLVGGKAADASLFLKVVYGLESSKDSTKGQCSALLAWIGATKENGYTQSSVAMQEARNILTGETAQAMASA